MYEQFIYRFFSIDHDRLDVIYEHFKSLHSQQDNNTLSVFELFQQQLEQHIVWEEEILFPLFEGRTGMNRAGPTFVMRNEHRIIKNHLAQIYTGLLNGENIDSLCVTLEEVLGDHNNKEENILYPTIDKLVSHEDITDICLKLVPYNYDAQNRHNISNTA